MSSDVVLSAALRNNLLSLQSTQRLIDTTQARLATGRKVNSALDNAQSFFAAQALNNRAGDLSRLLDGIGQSIRTIEEADKGITALTALVEQAESVAIEAQGEIRAANGFARVRSTEDLSAVTSLVTGSGGTLAAGDDIVISFKQDDTLAGAVQTSADINIDATDSIYNIVAEINADATIQDYVRASIDANGRLQLESLVEGGLVRVRAGTTSPGADGFAYLGLDNVVGTENTIATTRQGGTAVAGRVLTSAVSGGTQVSNKYQASDTLDVANYIATGDTVGFEIIVDGVSSGEISVAATDTIQDLIDGINNDTELAGSVVATFNVDTGRIELEFGESVGQAEIVINATAAADDTDFVFGTGSSDVTGGAAGTDASSELFTFVGTSANLAQFEEDFNNIRDQIDGLVEDAGYRGTNLLNNADLTTFFNEDRTNSLVSEGVDFTSLGLGIEEADFTDALDVQESLDSVRASLDSVRSFGQTLANDLAIIQTRRDFTENTIQTLKAGADDLTLADQNEEGANLLALQTRQQLGITSLALASQSQQAVLRLF
ncbi:MAG: flagellin N-terminal helical domain-containing protein [Alphaproteobacteria bacterium]